MDHRGIFDVAVVGAGAAGLWACRELTAAGARVVLVSAPNEQGYASTRNQGWLHSGALFALFGAQRNASECVAGSATIRAYADSFTATRSHGAGVATPIVHDVPFRYVFEGDSDLGARAAACSQAGIEVRADDSADLHDLFGRPMRALRAPDSVADNSALLRALATESVELGLVLAEVPSLLDLDVDPGPESTWRLSAPGVDLVAREVVIAAGPLGPCLIEAIDRRHGLDQRPALEVTRTTVLCLHDAFMDAALICIEGGPHIVPFRTPSGGGATICIPFDNSPADPAEIHHVPTKREQQTLLDTLHHSMPGLASQLAGRDQRATWYACQKLIPSESSGRPDWRHNVHERLAPGLILAYAGKFTTAPLLGRQIAEMCLPVITGSLDTPHGSRAAGDRVVASQPFTLPPTHQLVVRASGLATPALEQTASDR